MKRAGDRGVSKVIGVVLMIAIVIVLAAFAGTFFLEVGQSQEEPAPRVRVEHGDIYSSNPSGCGSGCDQKIRLYHETGDRVPVSELEVVVEVGGKQARLINLPTDNPDPGDHITGDTAMIDERPASYDTWGGILSPTPPDTDGYWSSGDKLMFRIDNGVVDLEPGDEVHVMVVHVPSNTIIVDEEIGAQDPDP